MLLALYWLYGCSTSEKVTHTPKNSNSLKPRTKNSANIKITTSLKSTPKQTSQSFSVQVDTLTAQSRKKGNHSNSSIALRSSLPKKYYSIQIGAFKSQANIDLNQKMLNKRFKQPVITFFDGGIKMMRICIGNFPTKQVGFDFLHGMQKNYPNDYKNAWVAELKK